MSGTAILRRGAYAYPGGTAYLNPRHPAVAGLRLAAVATASGAMRDLYTGFVSTWAKSLAEVGSLGHTCHPDGTGPSTGLVFPAIVASESVIPLTMACIFKIPSSLSLLSPGQGIVTLNQAGGSQKFNLTGTGVITFSLSNVNMLNGVPFPNLIAGHDYFVVASIHTNSGVQPRASGVLVDMTFGTVFVASGTSGIASALTDTNYSILTYSSSGGSGQARVAAASISKTFLTPGQQLEWASDPWSLWYPDNVRSLIQTARTASSPTGSVNGRMLAAIEGRGGMAGTLNLFG